MLSPGWEQLGASIFCGMQLGAGPWGKWSWVPASQSGRGCLWVLAHQGMDLGPGIWGEWIWVPVSGGACVWVLAPGGGGAGCWHVVGIDLGVGTRGGGWIWMLAPGQGWIWVLTGGDASECCCLQRWGWVLVSGGSGSGCRVIVGGEFLSCNFMSIGETRLFFSVGGTGPGFRNRLRRLLPLGSDPLWSRDAANLLSEDGLLPSLLAMK